MNYRESSFAQNGDQRTEAPEPAVADRVVVAINNIPYTQLQIESYLNVKESLRDNADSSQVVNGTNWSMAIDAFTNDMMIHQDFVQQKSPSKNYAQGLKKSRAPSPSSRQLLSV
jgi:hypothetical protein